MNYAKDFNITVKIKDGPIFHDRKIPLMDASDNETWVYFENNKIIRAYPKKDVEYIELIPLYIYNE